MRLYLYSMVIVILSISCSTSRSMTMEDDIYYVPNKNVSYYSPSEHNTPSERNMLPGRNTDEQISRSAGSHIAPTAFTQSKQQTQTVSMQNLIPQAQEALAQHEFVNETIYENPGYWIGGFKGNKNDLREIQRIINLYPQGFAFTNSNAADIALNLSFDSDWNVYTENGRYWWFPSNSNIKLYSSLLFGTYPKHIWTVIWDYPRFDSWAFNDHFNWGINFGWGGTGWNLGFGFGWHDPWCHSWHNHWYSPWYDPWCDPWYGWHDPYWHHPHWNHPHWNRPDWNRPNWGGGSNTHPQRPGTPVRPNSPVRPGTGSNIHGVRPGSSVRPGTSNVRPGSNVRPNTGNSTRPGNTQPNVSPRPDNNTRPGSITRPGSVSQPNNTTPRPGSTTRPGSGSVRPGTATRPENATRPGSITRPSSNTRQNSRSTSNNTKTYSRPQNNYRPAYNTNTTPRYNPGNGHDGSIGMPSRSSGGNHSAPVRNDGGGSRRR